jgi:glycerol-3-phosphate dehydrogenase subunit B
MKRVAIVGAGLAGLAAAFAARKAGASVTLVSEGSGATVLAPAFISRNVAAPSPGALAFLDAARLFVPARLIASSFGTLVETCLAAPTMLDLETLVGGMAVVRVPRILHPEWDAEYLVRAWSEAARARGLRLTFETVTLPLTRFSEERDAPWALLAARIAEPERRAWLRENVHAAPTLLPPVLATLLADGVGEATALPPTSFALQFVRERDRLIDALGIENVHARVESIELGAEVLLQTARGTSHGADSVVVCTGGLIPGGLVYQDAGWNPSFEGASIRAALLPNAPVTHGSKRLEYTHVDDAPETLFQESDGLTRVGLLCGAEGEVQPRVYCAGDLRSARKRDAISCIEGALRAGHAAATQTLQTS